VSKGTAVEYRKGQNISPQEDAVKTIFYIEKDWAKQWILSLECLRHLSGVLRCVSYLSHCVALAPAQKYGM
jgi:hypothetical protein